jgi:hypothetical protein
VSEILQLTPDVPQWRRNDGDGDAERMEREAEDAFRAAEELREEAAAEESRGEMLELRAKKLRDACVLPDAVAAFVHCGLGLSSYFLLDFATEEALESALGGRWDRRELLSIGLRYALPVPGELLPAVPGRRAA